MELKSDEVLAMESMRQEVISDLRNRIANREEGALDHLYDLIDASGLPEVQIAVQTLISYCHGAAFRAGWWTDLKTGADLRVENNVPEKLMLIVSEVAEAMEGHRKNKDDDHLPQFKMIEVEIADAMIRLCDLAGGKKYRAAEALVAKLAYNAQRADHKPEARLAEGGKAY